VPFWSDTVDRCTVFDEDMRNVVSSSLKSVL
jgi:hypothetical protein